MKACKHCDLNHSQHVDLSDFSMADLIAHFANSDVRKPVARNDAGLTKTK